MLMTLRLYSLVVFSMVAFSCTSHSGLEKKAMQRLPEALESAMEEQMSLKGGADIQSPVTVYDCDSLCIIQFKAVARDPSAKDYSFPVRYIFLRDVVMSAATGHPVYADMVVGCPDMDKEELASFKKSCIEKANELYIYYVGATIPIDSKGL